MTKICCRLSIAAFVGLGGLAIGHQASADEPIIKMGMSVKIPSHSEVYVLDPSEKNRRDWWLDRVEDNMVVNIDSEATINSAWASSAMIPQYNDSETISVSHALTSCKVKTDGENDGSGARYFLVRECRYFDTTNGLSANGSFNFRAELVPYGDSKNDSGNIDGKIWSLSDDGINQIKENFRQAMVGMTNNIIAPQIGRMFSGLLAVEEPVVTASIDDPSLVSIPTEVLITERGKRIRINYPEGNSLRVDLNLKFNQ